MMKNTAIYLFLLFGFSCVAQQPSKKHEIAEISTKFGKILIWLYQETPQHKENFIKLAREGYFDSTTFHRVIKNFVIQGGDPNSKDNDPLNDGQGGPDYTIPAEIRPQLKHEYGAVGAAREGDNINPERRSSGSQFYIVINKNGTPHLNGGYTVFGKVISGMEVAEKIADQPKGQNDRPVENIRMSVKILTVSEKYLLKKYNFAVPK
ncbi:MAG TPA: peptidylprolyl isomerase [Bacteroidia bacterium]|nr:peptidylprolyl isomerase [Bacteroidia bacterium]HRS58394.1 peptidylprolyl isomerase [Bacteroidia bacterium]HRU67344.1 peptidylprolyl isomerase [Bacteroidia bacterium]